MNTISWFLYLIDIVGNLKFALFLSLMAGATYYVVHSIVANCYNTDNRREIIRGDVKEAALPNYKLGAAVAGAFMTVMVCIPTQSTMYAIAASQVGEQVIKSEAVQGIASDAQRALQQWIQNQISSEAKK